MKTPTEQKEKIFIYFLKEMPDYRHFLTGQTGQYFVFLCVKTSVISVNVYGGKVLRKFMIPF